MLVFLGGLHSPNRISHYFRLVIVERCLGYRSLPAPSLMTKLARVRVYLASRFTRRIAFTSLRNHLTLSVGKWTRVGRVREPGLCQ
jgi:hypothetical protein